MKEHLTDNLHKPKALRVVLENSAGCLRNTNKLISNLEGDFLERGLEPMTSPSTIARLQTIDLVSQTIVEISALLERIAIDTPIDRYICYNKIVTPVKLEGLRNRISDESNASSAPSITNEGNTVELF